MDLDPELVKSLIPRAKKQLRSRMKALRSALPSSARSAKSAAICNTVSEHSSFVDAQRIALFWPLATRGEVDVTPLDTAARLAGKVVYYPFMDAAGDVIKTGFRPVHNPGELEDRGRGFKEPPPGAPQAEAGDLDLVLMPALAVAESGHRLGYGSGFYDATTPEFSPPATLMVVAYDFQLMAEIPNSDHDVPVHIIITDQRTLLARAGTEAEDRTGTPDPGG